MSSLATWSPSEQENAAVSGRHNWEDPWCRRYRSTVAMTPSLRQVGEGGVCVVMVVVTPRLEFQSVRALREK